jgi:zinc D-Ala-D-Ala carboxypeptidase
MVHQMGKHCIIKLTENFAFLEFDCPCNSCDYTMVSQELADKLQRLRDLAQFPLVIDSGYRCHSHQKELRALGYETAAGRSSHEDGLAADVRCGAFSGKLLAELAEKAGFQNIGTAKYWIHVDVRPGGPRRWEYTRERP